MAETLTIGDLRQYLESSRLSPEALAKATKISNMTIRRLLKRDGRDPIPEKYRLQLQSAMSPAASPVSDLLRHLSSRNEREAPPEFSALLSELEQSGSNCGDIPRLIAEAKEKFEDPNLGQTVKALVTKVFAAVSTPTLAFQERALAVGALLYFVNPFDLIPDAIPVVGFIDDFAILTLVVSCLLTVVRTE